MARRRNEPVLPRDERALVEAGIRMNGVEGRHEVVGGRRICPLIYESWCFLSSEGIEPLRKSKRNERKTNQSDREGVYLFIE
jgi:hypothetical protein